MSPAFIGIRLRGRADRSKATRAYSAYGILLQDEQRVVPEGHPPLRQERVEQAARRARSSTRRIGRTQDDGDQQDHAERASDHSDGDPGPPACFERESGRRKQQDQKGCRSRAAREGNQSESARSQETKSPRRSSTPDRNQHETGDGGLREEGRLGVRVPEGSTQGAGADDAPRREEKQHGGGCHQGGGNHGWPQRPHHPSRDQDQRANRE